MLPLANYFDPKDFSYWPQLERKIYKVFNDDLKYIYANEENGVRMLLLKYKNEMVLYYCENLKGEAIIPKLVERNGVDQLKEEYIVTKYKCRKSTNLDVFMSNLGEKDQIRTHENALLPNELPDEEIKKILSVYLK